ncbi:MAG: hypothetical protein K1V99_03690 [Bacteroidales bacterium]|nr:hypothetical protein [Bacteroidales bacterium]
MKRMICCASAALCMMSCEMSYFEVSPLSSHDLENYGTVLFAEYVCAPLHVAELVTAFDAYLQLPEEEKQNDSCFYENIWRLDEGIYSLADSRSGYIECQIDTGEKTLASGKWKITNLRVRIEDYAQGLNLFYTFYYYDEFVAELVDGALKLYNGSGSSVDAPKSINVSVTTAEDNGYLIEAAGREKSDSGLGSVAETVKPMKVGIRKVDGRMEYDGVFAYSTFRYSDNRELDRCSLTLKPGYLTKFDTGR